MPKNPPEPCDSPIAQRLAKLNEKVNRLRGVVHQHGNKIGSVLQSNIVLSGEVEMRKLELPKIEALIVCIEEGIEEITERVENMTERAQC